MSDIRKIQTGSNQYTLHARVSDKLAIMCSSRTHNKSNYPFHRILKTDVYTNASYENHGITLCLSEHYSSQLARFGIVNIEFSQQGNNNSVAHIIWVVRNGFKIDDIQAGLFATANGTYIDVYLKNEVLGTGISIYCMNEGNRGIETQTYKFVNSDEVNDTTVTDKKTSYEVYKTIEEAATQLHGKAYTSIIKPTDSGTVANAGYAEKIGTNKSHPQIGSSTKPVYVDSSGQVKACSREIPTGMTIDSVLNDTSVNAVQNKVINAALKGKNPKAKADFIASSDLTALPITAGVLDLNGYTLTLSGTTQLTDTLTIKNGTIGGEGTLQTDQLIFVNDCDLIVSSKINLSSTISILDNIHVKDVMSNFFILNVGEDYYATISPSAYCLITNFSGITIEGTNTNYNIIAQNGNNLLARNAKIKVLNVSAVEFQGKFDADIYNCQNIRFNSSQVDKSSTYTISFSTVETGTGQSFVRYGFKDQNGVVGDSLKPNDIIDASDHSVITSKAVVDYLQNYAKKSDISAVYRYKGTKTNYSELPTSGNNIGDVWNITNADTANHIKAGDNVVWDGSHWDNLSGTVANAGYAEKIGTDKSHPQIGSPTKPVYVDSSGQVKACSREIPTGITIDTKLSATSGNAVSNKVITEALNGKNPKAKADFIASSDLPGLPITTGVLDLNGYTLTLSGTTQLTGTLTIKNGKIGGEGIISSEDAVLYIYDCQLSDSAKISISCMVFVTDNLYYSHALDESIYITMPTLSLNNKTIAWISNSSCIRIKGQLTSAGVGDFGVSSIINSTWIVIQNIAINIKTSNNISLSGVICAHIDSCSNVNPIPVDIPEFMIDQIDQNSIIEISNCIFDNGTNTSLIREGEYDVQNHRYSQLGYVGSIKGYDDNYYQSIPTTNAILDYLKNYAKKSDISTVYKYKGTKTNYSELPTSGNNIGDVWNITKADRNNNIKAGDNVVWDGSKWDNLSGTVDLSNYLQKGGKQTTTSTADGGSNVYTFTDGSTITVKNGSKGSTGAAATWFSGSAVTGTSTTAKTFTVSGSKAGDMYLNTGTSNVYKATAPNQWVYLCNIKGAKGDAADIPKLAKGVAGIVPGTTNDSLNASRWLNGGDNGTGKWSPLPTAGGGTTGIVRTCKDYTGSINKDDIHGYGHGTTPPTLQPITSGASDYRGVESDGSGRLFVNVPAYEKNINRAQNTVLAAPTTGTGTATFRKLTTSDIPWGDKFKVVTESQFNSTTPRAGVFYFVLEE